MFVNELTQVGYFARVAYPVYAPGTIIGPGYQGTLGYGFPTGLGAAAGNPGRVVVSITGDGGFGWTLQELATAARYKLNHIVVVFADGAFANVRGLQQRAVRPGLLAPICTIRISSRWPRAFGVRRDQGARREGPRRRVEGGDPRRRPRPDRGRGRPDAEPVGPAASEGAGRRGRQRAALPSPFMS